MVSYYILSSLLAPCLCITFQFSCACSVQSERRHARNTIINLLDQSISTGTNGIYCLHLSQDENALLRKLSIGSVIRAPTGSTVIFRCNGSNFNLSPNPQPSSSQFMYNGQFLYNFTTKRRRKRENLENDFICCDCATHCDTKKLTRRTRVRQNPVTNSFTVELDNFFHMHSGKYECVRFRDDQWVVTHTYLVSPQLTPLEIFQPPMRNVTKKVGENVHLRCFVKFWALQGDLAKRFMWRNEEYLISAPGISAFGTTVESRQGSRSVFLTENDRNFKCRCLSTLMIFDLRKSDSGSYQCWFKIDDLFQEWVMQEIYLTVNA
ncbi:uncharacterized protein LOC129586624 [Paramacrobiotus metropolitanus]|uniref:uncharacterized protein LOC129586624 n=1 Tax=Paramacrobiotus metropolitanus TaxID=2943436 RepID=UPI002446204D|nr:uncharacterized protein LOC129586624 [Paramacrobiotus metropolitanus]